MVTDYYMQKNKKKILFVAQSLKIGGIERALVDQLNSMDTSKYAVDLLLFSQTGEYLNEVGPHIRLLKSKWFLNIVGKTQAETKGDIINYCMRGLFAVLAKTFGSRLVYNFFYRFIRPIKGYDVAISYVHDGSLNGLYYGCNSFVLKKVVAKSKIAWIHSDYLGVGMNCKERDDIYAQFDKVVNVSQAMKHKFDSLNIVPKDSSKVVYNRIDTERIKLKAHEPLSTPVSNNFTIVSVCRIEEMKGVLPLCRIAKKLKENGCAFTWLFIGKGNQLEECKRFIDDNYLNNYIKFLGALSNPYPYIKNADIFVSGSISETFGLSIFEAIQLGTVVVAKKYDAINEVIDGHNGLVADTFDEIFENLYQLYKDKQLYMKYKSQVTPLMDYNQLNAVQFSEILK